MSSIITSALDLMHMSRWNSMNPEVRGTLNSLNSGKHRNGQMASEFQLGLAMTTCFPKSKENAETYKLLSQTKTCEE